MTSPFRHLLICRLRFRRVGEAVEAEAVEEAEAAIEEDIAEVEVDVEVEAAVREVEVAEEAAAAAGRAHASCAGGLPGGVVGWMAPGVLLEQPIQLRCTVRTVRCNRYSEPTVKEVTVGEASNRR